MVADYISRQRTITRGGVHCVLFDDTVRELLTFCPSAWTDQQVLLLRTLLQPSQQQLIEALDASGLIEELGNPELDGETTARLKAWLDPLPVEIEPNQVWCVTFAIEGGPGCSDEWGWRCTQFNEQHDLLCEFGVIDEDMEPMIQEFGYVPLGLIDRNDAVRSAALLLLNHRGEDAGSVFEFGSITCATSIRSHLSAADVYRLMMAYSGMKAAVTIDEKTLIAREVRGCTVEDVEELMA